NYNGRGGRQQHKQRVELLPAQTVDRRRFRRLHDRQHRIPDRLGSNHDPGAESERQWVLDRLRSRGSSGRLGTSQLTEVRMKTKALLKATSVVSLLAAGCENPAPLAIDVPSAQFDLTNALRTGWSEHVHLEPPINTSSADQSPALSPDGLSLYFASDRAGSLGGVDLWVSRR